MIRIELQEFYNSALTFFEWQYQQFLNCSARPDNFKDAAHRFSAFIMEKHEFDVTFEEISDSQLYRLKLLRSQINNLYSKYMVFGSVTFNNYDQYIKFKLQYGG